MEFQEDDRVRIEDVALTTACFAELWGKFPSRVENENMKMTRDEE